VAEYIGEVLVASQWAVNDQAQQSGVSVQSTLVLGGQIAGERPGLYMVYPLGNCIATSPETPYLQIGESKYGKPILDRILRPGTTLEDAARVALVSLDSTIRSNLSVGMPLDMALIRAGDLKVTQQLRLEGDTPLYAEIHDTWSRKLENAVRTLPRFPWEPAREGEEQEDRPAPQVIAPPRRIASRQDPGDDAGQQ
jgi:putative proteasome-type protease